MQARSHYIDFVKGLATLSVIFIHTVWWSGTSYVPPKIIQCSLLFDVPIFFFVSGLTAGLSLDRTFKRLVKLQFSFMVYCAALAVLIWACGRFGMHAAKVNYNLLLNWFGHNYLNSDPFPMAIASMWFLQIYILVTLLGTGLLGLLGQREKWCLFLILLSNAVLGFALKIGQSETLQMTLFYGLIFVAGHLVKNHSVSMSQLLGAWASIALILVGVSSAVPGVRIFEVQSHKFPPDIVYLLLSCFSLSLILFFGTRFEPRESVVTYIGQNAIFFYFSQGISSSILLFIVPRLREHWPWYGLLPCMFALNAVMAFVLALGIKWIDERALLGLSWVRGKMRQPAPTFSQDGRAATNVGRAA